MQLLWLIYISCEISLIVNQEELMIPAKKASDIHVNSNIKHVALSPSFSLALSLSHLNLFILLPMEEYVSIQGCTYTSFPLFSEKCLLGFYDYVNYKILQIVIKFVHK